MYLFCLSISWILRNAWKCCRTIHAIEAASANARNTDGAAQKWQGWAKARAALESRTLSFNAKVLWSDMHGESLKDT